MAGNAFQCNVVYSSTGSSRYLWDVEVRAGDVDPNVSHNLYWNKQGGFSDYGYDSNPVVGNPNFVNPSAGNYTFASTPPAFCGTFKPIDTTGIGPLPNN